MFTRIEALPVYTEQELWRNADRRREPLYKAVAERLPPDARIFYPGAGGDRLPRQVFGPGILYGVIDDEYDRYAPDWTKPASQFPRYAYLPPVGEIQGVRDDIRRSAFPDDEFDLVLFRGLAHMHEMDGYEQTYQEMHRITKPGGLLVVEDEDVPHQPSLEVLEKWFQAFKRAGFIEHELDGAAGDRTATDDFSWEHLRLVSRSSKFNGMWPRSPKTLDEYLYYPRYGYHILRVLKKPVSVGNFYPSSPIPRR